MTRNDLKNKILFLIAYLLTFSYIFGGIYAYLILFYLVIFFAPWQMNATMKITSFMLSLSTVIFCFYFFDNIAGVDAESFFTTSQESDYKDLINMELERQIENPGPAKSRYTFPSVIDLYFSPFNISDFDSKLIFFFNGLFWFYSVLLWTKAISKEIDLKVIALTTFFLISSPSLTYWLTNFGKDIFSISLCLLSATCFLRKKYFLCFSLILAASFFRPYSVVLLAIYTLPFAFSLRYVIIAFLSSYVILMLASGNPLVGTLNALITFIYIFSSPNPVNSENWNLINTETWHFSPVLFTAEGVLTALCFLFCIIVFLYGKFGTNNGLYKKIMLCIFIAAFALTFVGLFGQAGKDIDPNVGSLGDNFVRKKMIAWPLVGIIFGLSIYKLVNGFKRHKMT